MPVLPVKLHRPFRAALVLYFAMLSTSVIGMIAILAGTGEVPADLFIVGVDSAIVLIACAMFRRQIIPPLVRRVSLLWIPAAAACAVVTFAFASVVVGFLVRYMEAPELTYSDAYLAEGYSWLFVVLIIAIQPAIIEELAFRGVILDSIQPVLSPTEALLVSALMFMVLHLSAPSFPHLFIMGLVLGYLRMRSGSLWPPIVLHFCHNFLVIASEYYFPGAIEW